MARLLWLDEHKMVIPQVLANVEDEIREGDVFNVKLGRSSPPDLCARESEYLGFGIGTYGEHTFLGDPAALDEAWDDPR